MYIILCLLYIISFILILSYFFFGLNLEVKSKIKAFDDGKSLIAKRKKTDVREDLSIVTSIQTLQPIEVYRLARESTRKYLLNSVQPSTRDSYISGWNYWVKWVQLFETDCRMTFIPQYWFDEEKTLSFGVSCFSAFMCYLTDVKRLAPGTVTGYVAGTRFYLASLDVDTSYLDSSPVIKRVRTGIWNSFRRDKPVADTRTLPLSCDMFVFAKDHIFNSNDPRDQCIRTSIACARSVLLRASETVSCRDQKHMMLSNDVMFDILLNGESYWIHGHEAYQFNLTQVLGMDVNIKSAINDEYGSGHKAPFIAAISKQGGYDLVIMMWDWAVRAQLKPNDPFFSYRGQWVMTYDQFNKAHKKIASVLGFDPDRYSGKSSRIGGACALMCAGFPDSFIMIAGRWKSLAFLYYVRTSINAYQAGLIALSNPNMFTMEDVRKLIPVKHTHKAIRLLERQSWPQSSR